MADGVKMTKAEKEEQRKKDLLHYWKMRYDKWHGFYTASLDFKYKQNYDLATSQITYDKKSEKYRNKYFMPIVERAIDGIAPKYILPVVGQTGEEFFDLECWGKTGEDKAMVMKAVLQYYFHVCPTFLVEWTNFIYDRLRFGNGFGKLAWCNEKTNMVLKMPRRELTAHNITEYSKETLPLGYEGPAFYSIMPWDMMLDPDETDFKKSWKIHRTYRTAKEILELLEGLKKAYPNIDIKDDPLEDIAPGVPVPYILQHIRQRNKQHMTMSYQDRYELWECWDKHCEKVVYIVGTGLKIIAEIDNPLKYLNDPFICSAQYPEPHQIYAKGVPDKAQELQELLNVYVNIDIDNAVLFLNSITLYDETLDPNVINKQLVPGGRIPVPDVNNSIKNLQVDYKMGETQSKIMFMEQEINDLLASDKYNIGTGMGNGNAKTASEANLIASSGSERHALSLFFLDRLGIVPLVEGWYKLILQCASPDMEVKIAGKWVQIDPIELSGDYMFKGVAGQDMLSKQQKFQKLMLYMNIMGKLAGPRLNLEAVNKYVGGLLSINDVQSFINPAQPMPQMEDPNSTQIPQMGMGNDMMVSETSGMPNMGGMAVNEGE